MVTTKNDSKLVLGPRGVNAIYGAIGCYDILSDAKSFTSWIDKKYPDINIDELLPGYLYCIGLIVGWFAKGICYDETFGLTSDPAFDRAVFAGVPPEEMDRTCEKASLLYILSYDVKRIKSSKNFSKSRHPLNDLKRNVLDIFANHLKENAYSDFPNSKNELYSHLIEGTIWLYFSCIRGSGIPYAEAFTPLHSSKEEDVIIEGTPEWEEYIKSDDYGAKDTIIRGYCYSLEYLIDQLFPNILDTECLKYLHNTENWYEIQYIYDHLYGHIFLDLDNDHEKDWYLYSFKNDTKLSKESLSTIFDKLNKIPNKSLQEELDKVFLWYHVGFLDASAGPFSGMIAFRTLLIGAVTIKNQMKNPEQVQVRIFKHHCFKGYDYSYAILMEGYGSAMDYSGWIVFFDTDTDYSGTGGYYHQLIDNDIQRYMQYLNVVSFEVKKETFEKYVMGIDVATQNEHSVSVIQRQDKEIARANQKVREIQKRLETTQDVLHSARGLIMELLTYYDLSRSPDTSKNLDWNIAQNKHEIDVTYVRNDGTVIFGECKVSAKTTDLDGEMKNLVNKMKDWKPKVGNKMGHFFFFDELSEKEVANYNKLKMKYSRGDVVIGEYDVLSEKIYRDQNWKSKARDKLDYILKYNDKKV
ncbi:MAG: hypothetical protein Q7J08_01855 [Methanocorpusculum sp.]|uniref:hypothetical protein n=1 Tax=Methanocorpusculum sp. TaxID=2058474 RepID=UPI002722CE27|nr:hypothetical protein [Methanocorpusculum sp.]MDO9522437.1 hypothetical protein [Methanocorpusculum sp.]